MSTVSGQASTQTRASFALDAELAKLSLDERGAATAFLSVHPPGLGAPLAVVIHAYNEEPTVAGVVGEIPRAAAGLKTEVIVVVDGARDATASKAAGAGALVCDVPVNRGQGAALRLGYRAARRGGAQYIVTTDADGQYNPAEIPGLLAPILAGEADFVTGSRTKGSEETRDPVRRLGGARHSGHHGAHHG